MRRKDREITDEIQIDEIIRRCDCCRLGFNDNGGAYIVPLSFGYEKRDGKRFFYFHSAGEGRKIDLIKSGGSVGFEMDCGYTLHKANAADDPCGCSAAFSSVIGTGRAELLTGTEEKIHGLQCLMRHTAGMDGCEFAPEMLERVCVIRLEVREISCKVHL